MKNDLLELVFSDRNHRYGAYQLRREYPANLGRALLAGLLLFSLALGLPSLIRIALPIQPAQKAFGSITLLDKDIKVERDQPKVTMPEKSSAPEPQRKTLAFVPPLVAQDNKVLSPDINNDVETLSLTNAEVGANNQSGATDLPPTLDPHVKASLGGLAGSGQDASQPEVFEGFDVHKLPSFPGGEAELLRFIHAQIRYPAQARESNIEGIVAISFVVDEQGQITDIRILCDIGGGCAQEALQTIRKMPRWLPGEMAGRPVKVRMTLPVRFRLE
jgi:periplasmic protein TonB